ncbi:MAG TPA: peptidoglycan DD-metalloendopeptidase family protein [Coriobacteriia bacterium]|nr:peptidoglycan DD-metalloendopeptidase family protein [Coriobacteriia bacterium]
MRRILSTIFVALALFGMGLAIEPVAAVAASTGAGGWYWPVGYESFGTMSGWWDNRGYCWHLAQDMRRTAGSPVYAVGSGTVLESKYVGGYGPGGSQGGAVVILHRTATGREFKALYGHLSDLRYDKGDNVGAGAVIGRINGSSPNHLHFGIHPGREYPSDNNPFRGHTYSSSNNYGWVDPVRYLKTNPRLIPYAAPGVPRIASVRTESVPCSIGAVPGAVYWQEQRDQEESIWVLKTATGVRSQLPTGCAPPVFDEASYQIGRLLGAPGFIVRDIRPRLSVRVSDRSPPEGRSVKVSGTVHNALGSPFAGAKVRLQTLRDGDWLTVQSVLTDGEGGYTFSFRPGRAGYLRTVFIPPHTFVRSESCRLQVVPE